MGQIKVLDVTLRDGGCVNNFDFGEEYIKNILDSLEKSNIDYIEVGYIDESASDIKGKTKYCNEKVIQKYLLDHKKEKVKYLAMIDFGKYNIDNLELRSAEGIDGIRLAFHKENYEEAIRLGRKILDKGYEFYIQPMVTMRYSDGELLYLIELVNKFLSDAHGFYIVDSFGEMRETDINRIINLIDHNLIETMPIGYHSHNNLQLAYSNAINMLAFPTNRNKIFDVSVMGMGKGAGNLNTELLLEHLNIYYQTHYKIDPLMALIDQVINVIHKEFYWGYSAEYYLSSINHCTPSYSAHFYNKHMLPISDVKNLLEMIEEKKKISFDKNYAEELYVTYNEQQKIDDSEAIKDLQKQLKDKKILIIAPGRTIADYQFEIRNLIKEKGIISIALNNFKFDTNFVFITRKKYYENALRKKVNIITPSNVTCVQSESNVYIIDYKKWICQDKEIKDASGVMVLNLLKALGIKSIILAGYDGFSADVNRNYFDRNMRITFSPEQAQIRNNFYINFFKDLKKSVSVEFFTPSIYKGD